MEDYHYKSEIGKIWTINENDEDDVDDDDDES